MRKRTLILIGGGALFLTCVWLFLYHPFEPKYDGETFGYWMDHWYREYGNRNAQAIEAVRVLGTNTLPYFVKWIGMPMRSSSDTHYWERALEGFQILGSNASPAIPDLVKMIGRNGNFPACALGYIGTNAIPALTNKLLESVATTNKPPARTHFLFPDPGRSRWPREDDVQRNVLLALSMMGTNAQTAVPAIISYLRDPRALELSGGVEVLAVAGCHQPDTVLPVLIKTFSNSSGYVRASAADALASFGTNAKSAIPVLVSEKLNVDANVRSHIAVAMEKIAPETPQALDPLIQNLESHQAVQESLYLLETLGTNGVEAIPALLKCLHNPERSVRDQAELCVQNINFCSEEVIDALGENLSLGEAYPTLGKFAGRSKYAFITLVKKGVCSPVSKDVQQQSKWMLIGVSQKDPTFMLECLEDSDPDVRAGALRVFYELERGIPSSIPKLRQMATNDPAPFVRDLAARVFRLQQQ